MKLRFYSRRVATGPKPAPEMVYVTDEIFVKNRRCSAIRGNYDHEPLEASGTVLKHSVDTLKCADFA